jgi:hypothetical protein
MFHWSKLPFVVTYHIAEKFVFMLHITLSQTFLHHKKGKSLKMVLHKVVSIMRGSHNLLSGKHGHFFIQQSPRFVEVFGQP